MNCRFATEDDAQNVIAMYQDEASFGGTFDLLRDTLETLTRLSDNQNLIICELSDRLVGSVQILANEHSAWLIRFTVDSRSEGVAEELFKFAKVELQKRGHSTVLAYAPASGALDDRYENKIGMRKGHEYRAFYLDF